MNSPHECAQRAQQLNSECRCRTLDHERLGTELARVSPDFATLMHAGRPHLFAESLVYVGADDTARMAALVAAVERVVQLPAYRDAVAAWAPANARHDPGTPGACLGYDFHLTADGPRLIEINTNAGGALINALLRRATVACCDDAATAAPELAEDALFAMFAAEWSLWRAKHPQAPELPRVALVDEAPERQFLYPEFLLFQRLFAAQGWSARICDPGELRFDGERLWLEDEPIDLVYNRLTDFSLAEPAQTELRAAYLADAALLTPHPCAHARYADKRNLTLLSDAGWLTSAGVDAATREVLLAVVPRTETVDAQRADDFWARRRGLFFKPAGGYGSRAAYRGDKLTRRVFDEILAGEYVAQALVPPSTRRVPLASETGVSDVELKLDLRCYAYAGAVQLFAARLWQGQTTNFRTPGGGFAAVQAVPCREQA